MDPSQFSAAILNLVINARDAMPNGGEVRISTARCDVGAGGNPSEEIRASTFVFEFKTMVWVCLSRLPKGFLSRFLPRKEKREPA